MYLGYPLGTARPFSEWLWEYIGRSATASIAIAAHAMLFWLIAIIMNYHRLLLR